MGCTRHKNDGTTQHICIELRGWTQIEAHDAVGPIELDGHRAIIIVKRHTITPLEGEIGKFLGGIELAGRGIW